MSHLLQILLLLSLVIAAAKLAGAAATRIGQPAVFGELLVGLLLGPTVLNVLSWPVFNAVSPDSAGSGSVPLLGLANDLADVGVILLMLVAGLETDLDQMRKVGTAAFWSAAGGVALPMIGGILTASAFGMPVFWTGIFVGTILTATSVSISAQVLMELGVLRTKVGATILGAAVIDDVMGLIVLSVVVAFAQASGGGSALQMLVIVGRMLLFFGAAILVGRYFEPIAAWGDSLGVSQGLLATVTLLAFLFAWAAEYVGGVAAITGSYLAGVLLTRTSFKTRIDEGVHPLTYSLLVPMFFISIGLRANGRELGPHAAFTIVLLLVAVGGKIVGSGALARICGFSNRESLRVGVGMISRGEVGLIVAGYGLSHGVIGQDVFSAAVIMVLATTMITPPLLRLVYPRVAGRPHVAVEEAFTAIPDEVHDAVGASSPHSGHAHETTK
jgi:Kef-type K+ transport system membrane component KefB